jgi:hypothetical protein
MSQKSNKPEPQSAKVPAPDSPSAKVPVPDFPTSKILESEIDLRAMFSEFMKSTVEEKTRVSSEMAELRKAIATLPTGSPQSSMESPIPDRQSYTRRSSMFFGSPTQPEYEPITRNQIQVLQADIIYDKELKVSSLEGLQYLAKQMQLYTSKYPGREVKTAHMVAHSLRPHVIAAWNTYLYKDNNITGTKHKEVMVEDWLSLSNTQVQAILLEAARPRTRELYSRDLVLFLGKGIPQTPAISVENFSQLFYAPLMKSLNDLLHLHDLLSADTSNHSNNQAKMPQSGYGTRDTPGQTQLWIISLGTQKDSILQWLGKDELCKHKVLENAVKFIRSKLMQARLHSEERQDFESKLTPVRYEDIRHTQGESHTRQQVNFTSKPQPKFPAKMPFLRDNRPYNSLSAIQAEPQQSLSDTHDDLYLADTNSDDDWPSDDIDYDDPSNDSSNDSSAQIQFTSIYKAPPKYHDDNILTAIQSEVKPRNAIANAFRGYCSELFVFGSCSRRDTNCILDHSSAGQERCIMSFSLLAKRELHQHDQLPPFLTPAKPERSSTFQSSFPSARQDSRIPKPYPSTQPPRSYNK